MFYQEADAIAHEFMHAIMKKYGIISAPSWYDEAFATMSSLVYLKDRDSTSISSESGFNVFYQYIDAYVRNHSNSLTSNISGLFNYGAMVFPLCLYENHGGWNTIKTIFENYTHSSSYLDSFEGSYNNQRFNFDSIFTEMAIANLIPSNITYGHSFARENGLSHFWPIITPITYDIPCSFYDSISPLSNKYYRYYSPTNIGNIYITVSSFDYTTLSFIRYRNAQEMLIASPEQSTTRIVYPFDNFGINSSNREFVIIATNTQNNNYNDRISINISFE